VQLSVIVFIEHGTVEPKIKYETV